MINVQTDWRVYNSSMFIELPNPGTNTVYIRANNHKFNDVYNVIITKLM